MVIEEDQRSLLMGMIYAQFKRVKVHPKSLMIADVLPTIGELVLNGESWAYNFVLKNPGGSPGEYVARIIVRKGKRFFIVRRAGDEDVEFPMIADYPPSLDFNSTKEESGGEE